MLSFAVSDSVSPDLYLADALDVAGAGVRELTAFEFGNAVAYALYLQERHGYFVVSDEHLLDTLSAFIGRLLASDRPLTDATLAEALAEAASEEVRWLVTFVGEMRPPAGRSSDRTLGGPERPARQGGWADISTDLVNGYFARVGNGPVKRYPLAGTGQVPSVGYAR